MKEKQEGIVLPGAYLILSWSIDSFLQNVYQYFLMIYIIYIYLYYGNMIKTNFSI